jgi:hypothetical protein
MSMSESPIPFNQVPNLVAGHNRIYRLDSFTLVQYSNRTYRGPDTFECALKMQTTNLTNCYLDLTYRDAYLLELHLTKLGEGHLSAHKKMQVMKGLLQEEEK